MRVAVHAVEPREKPLVGLVGIASDGGAFEMPTLGLSTWDETGRATLIAMYEPADRIGALARLAEAAGPSADE